jgi:hypothetical protein
LNLFDHIIFFDKVNLNFNEVLLIGEEKKNFFFYTHWYTKAFGFNILKDFYYFNHDVNTFILLYPLYSSEYNPLFLDSESIFYNNFKVELSYADIPICITTATFEKNKNNLEKSNLITELNLLDYFKKKYNNCFYFFDENIFDSNYDNIIENIFEDNEEEKKNITESDKNNNDIIIKKDQKYFLQTLGQTEVNDELFDIIKQQQQDLLNDEQYKTEIKFNQKLVNDYHLNMDLSRTYYPPTVRDNERADII